MIAGTLDRDKLNGRASLQADMDGERIAFSIGAYNHIVDGSSLTLNRLVAHVLELGADARIFAPTTDQPQIKHAGTLLPVRSFRFPGYLDYRVSTGLSRTARAQLKAFAPTLVHVATPDFTGLQLLRFARKNDIPLVSSYHTHFPSYLAYYRFPLNEAMLWKYLRWYYGQCEHLYVPSESMATVLRSHGITTGLRLWERGVDTMQFNPAHRSLVWRRSLGIADEEVLITFVSRLVWEKGLDVFAKVIDGMQRTGIKHRSMIVGDGPIREELVQKLPETIFVGYLRDKALSRAYASSDVFLFPSATETFGNVTLEGMASGAPAVCADATGSSSLVVDGITGLLAPQGDADRFREAVERLVNDTGLRIRLGQQALARAKSFEWGAVLDRVVGYYEEILNPERVAAEQHRGDGHAGIDDGFSMPVKDVLLESNPENK